MTTPTTVPPLDTRDNAAVIAELRALIPFYTPHWQLADQGPGRALAEVFAQLQREVIARLNRVPEKFALDYLDRLGLSVLPAQAARAPVVFTLAKGATKETLVPSGARVAAGEVIFETQSALNVTPAQLVAVYSVMPQEDRVLDHATVVAGSVPAHLFDTTSNNAQEHALYLADGALFNIKSAATLVLTVDTTTPQLLRGMGTAWEWWGKDDASGVEGWQRFSVSGRGNSFLLTKLAGEIQEIEFFGVKSRWLRCRLTAPLRDGDALAYLQLRAVTVAPVPAALPPEAAVANDIPLKLPAATNNPLLPFGERPRQGDTFYIAGNEALSKPGATVALNLNGSAGAVMLEPVESVHGIGSHFTTRLRRAGLTTVGELLRATPETIAAAIRNQERDLPTSRYLTRAGRIQDAARRRHYDTSRAAVAGIASSITAAGPRLSWEYWNGSGWVALNDAVDGTNQLQSAGAVMFTCPKDLQPVKVGGQEHRWIRVRIAGGDYGQEKFTFVNNTWATDTSDIHAPSVSALSWSYSAPGQPVSVLVTRNNLDTTTITALPCTPFVALPDEPQGLYLGFDRPLVNGPFNLLAILDEFAYAADQHPRLTWEYADAQGMWQRLAVADGTAHFTLSGIVSLNGPSEAALSARLGQTLFWVRALDVERRFNQPLPPVNENAAGDSLPLPGVVTPCAEDVIAFRTLFPYAAYSAIPAPSVRGLYMNAAWVQQSERLNGERFGSSDGTASQTFRLARGSVLEATIWVNEADALAEEEIAALPAEDVQEERDLSGQRRALWIRWQAVAEFTLVSPDARVYQLDAVPGTVTFGDGLHGRVPPAGHDNLKADYRVGGGVAGNVAARAIKELKSGVARIDKIYNPVAAEGGADTETTAALLARGPLLVRHRQRAVTARDYEDLAREATREVGRVRCLPHTDDHGRRRPGWVTLLIAPSGTTQARPVPRPSLQTRVREYVAARAPHVVAGRGRVVVTAPVYVDFSVTLDVHPHDFNVAAEVEAKAYAQLTAFFHPLTGGLNGQGWQFGQAPCLSDIIALVQAIDGVDRVQNVRVQVTAPSGATAQLASDTQTRLNPSPYTLPASGEHRVRLVLPV